jgi:predicted protein tyrosine phosphatase
MKILFVCDANLNRSPTFEKWFKENTEYEVKSTGTFFGYPEKIDKKLLDWANKVFVMDLKQEMEIAKQYPDSLPKVEIIGISDEYEPHSPRLIKLVEYWWKKRKWIDKEC